jgi:hypothetical protein
MRRKHRLSLLVLLVLAPPLSLLYPPSVTHPIYPNGKRFAFSIIDDTDMATLDKVKPVYDVLEKYGMRTTKTVWVFASNDESNPTNRGDSLNDPAYRAFILDLQKKGFEIALHGVRGGSSPRKDIEVGLDEYRKVLGDYPRMHINHALNKDNLYWGSHLFSFAPYRWLGTAAIRHEFSGHDRSSPFFWGDLAKRHVQFVRRYTFHEPNLLKINPGMPYQLPETPFVNYWFPTSNGNRVRDFDALLSSANIARLAEEGGVCLVYAHLGAGSFSKDGKVDPRFEARIKELSEAGGWFVPASDILDFLKRQPHWAGVLSYREKVRLDTQFLVGRIFYGAE